MARTLTTVRAAKWPGLWPSSASLWRMDSPAGSRKRQCSSAPRFEQRGEVRPRDLLGEQIEGEAGAAHELRAAQEVSDGVSVEELGAGRIDGA